MQSNSNTENEIQTNEILDYYAGLQNRSSQEMIVEMLRELQEVNGCIGPGLRDRLLYRKKLCSKGQSGCPAEAKTKAGNQRGWDIQGWDRVSENQVLLKALPYGSQCDGGRMPLLRKKCGGDRKTGIRLNQVLQLL